MVRQNPLTSNIPITDKLGNPTPEFMRKWSLQAQINATIIDLSTASAVSAVLDKLGLATGDMLYRATTGWTVRTPGATATLLQIVGGLPTWSTMSGDATIASGGALTIAAKAVTYAKMQDVTDARLLGRSSGSAGPPIEITVGTGLSLAAGALTCTVTGGVTSVGLALDSGLYTVSGTPVTTTGTLTGTLNTQTANFGFFGPTTGSAAKPTFRAMVAADLPAGTTPVGANPTATGGDTAVNGSAATFMRSDGAPAIQKGSSAAFGLVKVDNTTVTATAGVISAVASATLDTISSTRGTILYRGASAWLGLAPGTAGYLLKTGGAGADPAWVSGPVGSTGNTYALSCIAAQTVKASAFATQGIAIIPLTTFTIDQVIVPINATSGHSYSLNVCVVNVSHVVQSIAATVSVSAGSSGKQSITFNLGAFVSLAGGTRYIISVTDTNAASGVTTMPTYNGGQATVWANLPVDPSDSDNQASYDLAKNTAPVATDTFLVATGVQVFQLRAQV